MTICRHDAGPGEQVELRADRAGQRGHHLLADRVERRVGHLREQLGEVVEQQPRALRQRRERGVRAHRAERLDAAGGHRREQDAQLLLGVAEDLLPPGDRLVAEHDVLTRGQVLELDQPGVQPLAVRVLGGEFGSSRPRRSGSRRVSDPANFS